MKTEYSNHKQKN